MSCGSSGESFLPSLSLSFCLCRVGESKREWLVGRPTECRRCAFAHSSWRCTSSRSPQRRERLNSSAPPLSHPLPAPLMCSSSLVVSRARLPGVASWLYNLRSCVTLSKLLNSSVLKSHICKVRNGKNSTYFAILLKYVHIYRYIHIRNNNARTW